jgi:ribosomal protein S18 acetylase RimI-like enzyme
MPQSSITSWFKKQSTSVKLAPEKDDFETSEDEVPQNSIIGITTKVTTSSESIIKDSVDLAETARPSSTSPASEHDISKHRLPPNVNIEPVTEKLLPEFRRLVQLLLPIPYPDKFYNEIISDPVTASVTLAATWKDRSTSIPKVVAGVRGKVLATSPAHTAASSKEKPSLYIATVCTLAPYRGHGLAPELLSRVIVSAIEAYGIGTVTAHVWEASAEARAWYKKLGFEEVQYEPMYYRRLKPNGAFLLERVVCPTDLLKVRETAFDTS